MQQNIAWQIELLRMTFFFEMKERIRWESFWEAITHQSPESKTEKTTVLQTIEEGTWNEHSLTVALQANRIDIVWHAKDVEEAVLPNLGESNSFETFIESIASALTENTLACIHRAAFGAVLLAPTQTRDEAYLLLSKYLPSVKISLNSRDLTYQINRPIPSKVRSEREVNRFSKWAAIQATYVDLQQNSFNIVANACRLELDISTSNEKLYQESEPITSSEILEFIELASYIATNGDVE